MSARAGGGADGELEELRARVRTLLEEGAANERKLRRTLERELELVATETLPDLLAGATHGLAASYALDAVTLLLEDPNHELQHLLLGAGDRLEEFPQVQFVETLAGRAPQFGALRRPWLGAYVHADHALLFPGGRELASLALVPLRRQAHTSGVLCFGSRDPARFSREMSADFLEHLGGVLAVCLENAANRARVLRSGLSDYLTGWPNRRYLAGRLREELARAQRSGASVACLMIDVDRFKQLNDHFGHLGGDEALREIAARIESQVRASDTASRFGGDEFALLLPDATVAEAARLAARIQAAMVAPIEVGGGRVEPVTLSIGVAALAPARGAGDLKALADGLLADADAALYRAKAEGRNRIWPAPGG